VREDKFWEAAIAIGNKEAIEAYLESYPKGQYVSLAKAQLLRLDNRQPSAIPKKENQNSPQLTLSQLVKDCPECPEMVFIPAGSYEMGSGKIVNERPPHMAYIRKFFMGKTEVTQKQWQAVMGYNPSFNTSCGEECPVERVSWNDAQQFIDKLNQKTGKKYRLPSEAEWEYAARAGTTTEWSHGDDESKLNNYSWYAVNSGGKTQAVGGKLPNAFGLFDMHGNVWEWMQDCWHLDYAGAPTDGGAWATDCNGNFRVRRGGSLDYRPLFLRSADRSRYDPTDRNSSGGFRLAREL
jgi:formylglycine-generating enzyme required for sulfatase activity